MELSVTLREPGRRAELFGPGDSHLRRIRDSFGVKLHTRNAVVRILGEPAAVAQAAAALEKLQDLLRKRQDLDDEAIDEVIATVEQVEGKTDIDAIRVFGRETISARTAGQREYLRSMLENDLVFCVGPAGTGKTYLAVAIAVHLLKMGQTKRIALVRPAVEAGERLGFLPGDLQQKVNPYLRPLFDAMHDMMTFDQLKRFMVNDIIEVIPLAYMRGRTLNHAVIILDEAQNTTTMQMLMFLTRLGNHSKMIVTGDDSQIDLDPGQPSGLRDAVQRLSGCKGIETLRLKEQDIVRHKLVQEIVRQYDVQAQKHTPTPRSSDKHSGADSSGAD